MFPNCLAFIPCSTLGSLKLSRQKGLPLHAGRPLGTEHIVILGNDGLCMQVKLLVIVIIRSDKWRIKYLSEGQQYDW